jgi:hypothetical protein
MAVVPSVAKNTAGALNLTSIALATSGDTLVFTKNAGQELHLFNTSASPVVVTVDGSDGTTINVPDAGDITVSVAAGYPMTVPAGKFTILSLDKVAAFLKGTVAITAATGAVVQAAITQ